MILFRKLKIEGKNLPKRTKSEFLFGIRKDLAAKLGVTVQPGDVLYHKRLNSTPSSPILVKYVKTIV